MHTGLISLLHRQDQRATNKCNSRYREVAWITARDPNTKVATSLDECTRYTATVAVNKHSTFRCTIVMSCNHFHFCSVPQYTCVPLCHDNLRTAKSSRVASQIDKHVRTHGFNNTVICTYISADPLPCSGIRGISWQKQVVTI